MPEPAHPGVFDLLLRWWSVLLVLLGWGVWVGRKTVTEPRGRIAALEAQASRTADTVAGVREDLDEVRVALAQMSDAHAAAIHEQTARIDRVLELLLANQSLRRRHFDPNNEEG